MNSIHVSARIEKSLQSMEQAGKAGRTLARKAAAIIESLASGEAEYLGEAAVSCTKYGEKRIRNCRKYDLGCGYRLITIKRGETVFIPFLGSHDECQRWLANHSRLTSFQAGKGKTVAIENATSTPADPWDPERMNQERDDDDGGWMQPLTDKELRRVFKGLVAGGKRGGMQQK